MTTHHSSKSHNPSRPHRDRPSKFSQQEEGQGQGLGQGDDGGEVGGGTSHHKDKKRTPYGKKDKNHSTASSSSTGVSHEST